MPLNTRLNKNVVVSKFLDLVKEADDGNLLKSVEYVQLEQLMSENLPKHAFLNKLVNKLITDSTSFTLDELNRYNSIYDQDDNQSNEEEESDAKIDELQQHLNLVRNQKELLETELMKLYSYELDDELCKERDQLNECRQRLSALFADFKPLLGKRNDSQRTARLDQQLFSRLDVLKAKKLEIDDLIEEILMHVDLNLNRDKLVKIIEREYCLKLIQIKNLLESLKNETELILKIYRNKMNKNTIWKVHMKSFKEEVKNEENLISCDGQTEKTVEADQAGQKDAFQFDEFKRYLDLAKNDPLDDLLQQARQALKKVSD